MTPRASFLHAWCSRMMAGRACLHLHAFQRCRWPSQVSRMPVQRGEARQALSHRSESGRDWQGCPHAYGEILA
eukprot:scaffold7227_cov399-Prasinococcus_capsulatus_cf.AAC.11